MNCRSRIRFYIIVVSLCQTHCTNTNQANDATRLNCTPITDNEKCPSDWSIIDDPPLCLHHSPERRNFTESSKYCHSLGDNVDVVVTLSRDIGKAVKWSILKGGFQNVWISFNDIDGNEKWKWSDDKFPLPRARRHYEQWNDDELWSDERKYRCAVWTTDMSVDWEDTDDRDLIWKSINCSSPNSVICQMRTEGGKCKQNWIKLNEKFCFKPQKMTKSTFLSTKKLCNSQDAFLIYTPDEDDGDDFKEYLRAITTTWIGVESVKKDSGYVWQWTTGTEILPDKLDLPWPHRYDYIDPDKTCLTLRGDGRWEDVSCKAKYSVTCMRQWAKDPANTRLKLEYHRPDNVFYAGVPLIATCTFIADDPNKISWTVVNDSSVISIERNAFSVSTERLRSDEGFCISRVTSTLVLRDWGLIQNATISCFATSIARLSLPSSCTDISKALTTCDAKVFSVVAGPTGRPHLQLKHDGRDVDKNIRNVYKLEAGKRNIVRCTVPTGKYGTLQWALSLKNETRILDHDDKRIVSYKRNEPKQEVTSDVTLRLQLSESGIIVSCFGYDVKHYHNGKLMPCRDDDLFCTKLQIEVYSDPDPEVAGYQWLSYPNLGFFIGLIAIFAIWFTFFRTAKSLSIHQGEDQPIPRSIEHQIASDVQPPSQEVLQTPEV